MSCLPPGCARVLSGWCHGCVWDDDLWLWSRVRPCSLFSLPPDIDLKWGWGWGRLMDGPLLFPVMLTWADRCQDVIIFCDNLFYKRRLNSEQKTWPFQKDIEQQKRLQLFQLKCVHGFLFSKTQKSARCLTWNCTWTYSSALCFSRPRWPCSIARLAVAVFIAPYPVCTVQYSLLTWCLQQKVQVMMVDGDWNVQKGGSNHKIPSSFQSLWIIGEIKCFYLFQVNCSVS